MRLWRGQKRAEVKGAFGAAKSYTRTFAAHSKPIRRCTDGWCYIYVIQDGDLVKIGKAIHPIERLRNLQTAHSRQLTLVAAIPAHAALERAIHNRFAHLRAESEWFRLDESLERFIDDMKAGKNPVPLVW